MSLVPDNAIKVLCALAEENNRNALFALSGASLYENSTCGVISLGARYCRGSQPAFEVVASRRCDQLHLRKVRRTHNSGGAEVNSARLAGIWQSALVRWAWAAKIGLPCA